MSKTIIKQITFMCPNGIGKLGQEGACRFHRASDNMTADGKCPDCKLELEKAVLDEDRMTKTVMGEETIEEEIEDRDEVKHRAKKLAEVDVQVEWMDVEGEFATPVKKEKVRASRRENVEIEIAKRKRQKGSKPSGPTFRHPSYFLKTPAEIDNYRNKRKEDITKAIIEARKLEDK